MYTFIFDTRTYHNNLLRSNSNLITSLLIVEKYIISNSDSLIFPYSIGWRLHKLNKKNSVKIFLYKISQCLPKIQNRFKARSRIRPSCVCTFLALFIRCFSYADNIKYGPWSIIESTYFSLFEEN